MGQAKFILSKKRLLDQLNILLDLGLKVSYSYKTNKDVGNVLQTISDCDFSIHSKQEVDVLENKQRIWFFTQAESEEEIISLLDKRIRRFVVDSEIDLENLLSVVNKKQISIWVSFRMRFKEHRIGTGKYFVYGMPSKKIKNLIDKVSRENFVEMLGVHIHRKSQNTSEWEIKSELKDSLGSDYLQKINFINFGGGLPVEYKNYTSKVLDYIFEKISEAKKFLDDFGIETYIEPGRFLAAPSIKLETEIVQIQDKNIIINTSIYNCALDTLLTGIKMLVEGELSEEERGNYYLLKGNSPTRDDIFRYKVKLNNPKVGDIITFMNAGAYNYSTDFFGYVPLKIEALESF